MTADTIHPAFWIFVGLVAIALLALGYGILSHKIDLGKIHTALTTDKDAADAWIQAEFAKLHGRLDTVQSQNQMIHAAVQAPVQLVTAQVAASPAPQVLPPPTSLPPPATPGLQTQWGFKAYKDFPTYAGFAQLAMLTGRSLNDDEIRAWMAVTGNGDPRIFTAGGIDTTKIPVDTTGANADLPFGSPRYSFSRMYERGRNHLLPNTPQILSIIAPASPTGLLRLQFSGRGGSPAALGVVTDNEANVAVTIQNGVGVTIMTGNLDTIWPARVGETFTATLLADRETQQDITLNVG